MLKSNALACVFFTGYIMSVIAITLPALAESGGGYSGLMAPKKNPALQENQKPPGYGGLIPGKTATSLSPSVQKTEKKAPATVTPPTEPLQSQGPGKKSRPVQNADDIRMAAAFYAQKSGVEKADITLPKEVIDILAKPSLDKGGLSSPEGMTKFQIGQLFNMLERPFASKEEKKTMVKSVEKKLASMQEMFYSKKAVPVEVYKRLGLPDIYVQEKAETTKKSIELIEQAQEKLKKLL